MKTLFFLITLFSFVACSSNNYSPTMEDKKDAQALIDEGVLYLRNSEAKKALANFEVSLDIFYSAEALDGIGCAYFLLKDFSTAQSYFLKAYEYNNSYAPALEHLALLYDLFNYKEEANQLYQQALELMPKSYSARNNQVALLYDNQKISKERASNELLKAKAILEHPTIKENLTTLAKNK